MGMVGEATSLTDMPLQACCSGEGTVNKQPELRLQ